MIPESILIIIIISTFVIMYLLFKSCLLIKQVNNKIDKHCKKFKKDELYNLKNYIHTIDTNYYKYPKE